MTRAEAEHLNAAARQSRRFRFTGWILVALGGAQLAMLGAALARLIDPGPPAFNAVGTLAGLGI